MARTQSQGSVQDIKAEFLEKHAHCTRRWAQERKTELRSETPTPTHEAQVEALLHKCSTLQAEREAIAARCEALLAARASRQRRYRAPRKWLHRALRRAVRRQAPRRQARRCRAIATTLGNAHIVEASPGSSVAHTAPTSPIKLAEEQAPMELASMRDADAAAGAIGLSSPNKKVIWSPGVVAGFIAAVAVAAALRQRPGAAV